MRDTKFDWNDIVIVPSVMSDIDSRSKINIYNDKNKLPIFVSPMDTVVNTDNYKLFLNHNYEVCLVRGTDYKNLKDYERCFVSLGIDEAIEKYNNSDLPPRVLIDIANGQMRKLHDISRNIKNKYPKIELMVGNIANPDTYMKYSDIGVDYVRVGIGGGQSCTTAMNVSIHYPMGSLVQEIYDLSLKHKNPSKIIADGGFKNYSDIIKALAVGSDGVMLGGIFNKTIESAGACYFKNIKISQKTANYLFKNGFVISKKYRGMSTKEVQKGWGKNILKTSEGIVTKRKVEYTLDQWSENFIDYLKSAMSYTNSKNIEEFIGKVDYEFITTAAYQRFHK